MTPRIVVYRTDEISDELWTQIVDGFNEAFDLHSTVEGFKHGWYVANPWGYAFHAMAFADDGDLMAYNVFTPAQYENGIKVVVSGSTFVRKKYRKNVMLFGLLIKALRKRCADEGFDLEVGVPNHNSLKYHFKVNKVSMVKDLTYYVLPICLSKTAGKSLPSFVDGMWTVFLKVHLAMNVALSRIFNTRERRRPYSIATDEAFYSSRFKSKDYTSIVTDKCDRIVYRVYPEEGKRVAYLMDFRTDGHKTYRALVDACRYIIGHERVDAILYVGFMHLGQGLMVKLPKQMVPKRLPLTCYVLNKEEQGRFDGITNPDNWNFSLMSFDVR